MRPAARLRSARPAARLLAVSVLLTSTLVATPAGAGTDLAAACPQGRVFEDGFLDVRKGSTHDFAIDCLSWWQITSGSGLGNYTPDTAVTREQMATLLANALQRGGVALPAPGGHAFSDDHGSAHTASINALAAAGIVLGRMDGTYGPKDEVTRAQMASYLASALSFATGASVATATDAFADDDGSVHERNINAVTSAGIAAGFADDSFRPALPVRRDQIASFLTRMLDALVAAGRARLPTRPVLDAGDPIRWDGVGPIRVGMTIKQAARAAGVPTGLTDDFGGSCEYLTFADPQLTKRFGVMVHDGTVVRVENHGAFHGELPATTPEGIGPFSSHADVAAAFPGRLAQRPHPYTDGLYLVAAPPDGSTQLLTIFETSVSGLVTSYRRGFADPVELIEGCA